MSTDGRRDRTGELEADAPDDMLPPPEVPHDCDRGWLDYDADQPVPCPRCRPKLAHGSRVRSSWGDVR